MQVGRVEIVAQCTVCGANLNSDDAETCSDACAGKPVPNADDPRARDVYDAEERAGVPFEVFFLDRCDPECKGWAVFETDRGLAVEKCDACGVFETDEDCIPHARKAGLVVTDTYPVLVLGVRS